MAQSRCVKCVLDISVREIVFDENGVCNFCQAAQRELQQLTRIVPSELNFNRICDCWPYRPASIHTSWCGFNPNNRKEYDVLIGLSGGVDSSYTLHKAHELNLRPLCFSIDNGWNKPEADENIMRLVEGLKVPFFRYTINLENFRAMQAAFMKAGVKNIEIPTDHILMAASLELAARYNIKTILSGGNVATESIMPGSWGWNARDLTHIKSIYHGSYDGIPTCSLLQWNIYKWWYKIKTVYLLDYFDYNREKAEKLLIEKYGFTSTGEKHEENYFTWWFQSFYLFERWGIDKRKAHFSSLINSGQMTREEALKKLKKDPIYPELGLESKVLRYPKKEHEAYPVDKNYQRIANLVNSFKRIKSLI